MFSFQQFLQSIKQNINEIDWKDYNQSPNNYALLIDVREKDELLAGIVPGAVHIPRGILETQLLSIPLVRMQQDPESWLIQQSIAIYCRSGARSALSASSLQNMGLPNVVSIKGGFDAWLEQGFPIEPYSKSTN